MLFRSPAPYVTNTNDWLNLALKHVLKHAAHGDYDHVAFVNGLQSADRYDLSKYLSSIEAKPTRSGGYQLTTTDLDGVRQTSVDVPPDKLEKYVGKEMADRITKSKGGYFEGEGLRVPHKGMEDFYDKIVPAQVNALIKKHGGKPMRPMQFQLGDPQSVSTNMGFDLTPEMKQSIKKPMPYKAGGATNDEIGRAHV